VRSLIFLLVFAVNLPAIDFVADIHPVLAKRCWGCHTGAKAQAGLDLTTREGALRVLSPGDAAQSELLHRVQATGAKRMPPIGAALDAVTVEKLREWVNAGAPWVDVGQKAPDGWIAPLAPREVALPPGNGHPVDRFTGVFAKGLATDAVFARRVYLDVWGVTPSPEDLQAFLADRSPDKRSLLVDRLLAHEQRYTAHAMSWWNDLLRNDIGVVYHGDRKSITPWLERALRTNLPYDEMVRELLNPIGAESPEGFLIGVNWRGDVNASQTPYMQAAQNTAQVFLGINLKCASCHDSFINQYKLKQAYGLAALFSQAKELEIVRCDNKTGKVQQAEFLWPDLGSIPAGLSSSERRFWAAKLFTSPRNGRLARTIVNRYWQRLTGVGLVEPVDDMDAKPSNPDLLDWLAADLAKHQYDLKHLQRLILTSAAYQRADATPRRLSAEQLIDTLSTVTGEWSAVQSGGLDRAYLARDWQTKSNPLSRAMGRPIRDQVYTTRNGEATTFQSLELANGPTLAEALHRGVMRLLGELPDPPANLYDSKLMRQGEVDVVVPIAGLKQVWLLTEDAGTFDPDKAVVGWKDIVVQGPQGTHALQAGSVSQRPGTRMVFDVPKGYEALRAKVWVSDASRASDINAAVRFFVFGQEPDRKRLVRLAGDRPFPAPQRLASTEQAVERFWLQLLVRPPSAEERAAALKLFPGGNLKREGVEDLLWSLLMHPEVQYIW
jgi:hypothetical protein